MSFPAIVPPRRGIELDNAVADADPLGPIADPFRPELELVRDQEIDRKAVA
jgi:hypothetical protein